MARLAEEGGLFECIEEVVGFIGVGGEPFLKVSLCPFPVALPLRRGRPSALWIVVLLQHIGFAERCARFILLINWAEAASISGKISSWYTRCIFLVWKVMLIVLKACSSMDLGRATSTLCACATSSG